MPDFNECNTFRTWTLYVGGDNVTIKNLTIKNLSMPSKKYGQAVALHVDGNYFYAIDLNIESAQDTLFTGPLPRDLQKRHVGFLEETFRRDRKSNQKYINCNIKGDVDFIFGCATTLFYKCNIISINRHQEKDEIGGYLTAPSHEKDDKFGYIFLECNLINEKDASNVYLSRPWRDYGFAAFIDCKTGSHINEKGFSNWPKTKRYETARYFEYNENIDFKNRVSWAHILTLDEKNKLLNDFINYDNFFNYKK